MPVFFVLERANLVRICLQKLDECGVQVTSVTFDSPPVNQSLFKKLGGDLRADNLLTEIKIDSKNPINMILDNVHAIKNVRNAFAHFKVLKDGNGNKIEWRFIAELYYVQQKSTFHLANRLTYNHVYFESQKMKAKLAIQVFSRSTADAIDYCREKLKLRQFEGSEATTKFLRVFDEAFDILNVANKFGSWSKAPLKQHNTGYWVDAMETCANYIIGLQELSGRRIVDTGRNIGFVAFLVNFKSVQSIFFHYVQNGPLHYLLTFKFSQDHLESFFGCIRAKVGCGNNPTVTQFVAAYKKIILGASGRHFTRSANIDLQDDTDIVQFFTTKSKCISYIEEKFDLVDEFETFDSPYDINDMQQDVVTYIAGYVCRQVKKKNDCNYCCDSLLSDSSEELALISVKDRGGLIYPSSGMIQACKIAEKFLQVEYNSKSFFSNEKLLTQLTTRVTTCILTQYPEINTKFDHTPIHKYTMSKTIVMVYLSIRLKHLAREKNREMSQKKIRKKMSKIILFSNQ